MTDDSTQRDGTSRIGSDTGPFAIVPEWVIDSTISDGALRLYAVLSRYADADGYSWPSRRTLAARVRKSTNTLDRTVRELVDAGMLVVSPRFDDAGDRTSNGYTVRRIKSSPTMRGIPTDGDTGSRTGAATGSTTDGEVTKTILNENQSNELAPLFSDAPATQRVDVVWDALLTVCGVDPAQVTKASRGAYNRAAKDLRDLGATPRDIVERAVVFRRRWPDVSLTPTALARRWPECDPQRQHAARVRTHDEQHELERLTDAWGGHDR